MTDDDLAAARRADASDPRTAAALSFAAMITRERGRVSTSDVAALRQAGFGDEEIVEIVAAVALNVGRK